MRVRAFFNSKKIEDDMIRKGLTAADVQGLLEKEHGAAAPKYDAVVRVVSGRSNKQFVVEKIAALFGRTVDFYRVAKPLKQAVRPDARAGRRRRLR